MMWRAALLLLVLAALANPAEAAPVRRTADGAIYRSAAAVREFKATHTCPATHTRTQHCPGHVVDHIRALACAKTEAQRALLDQPWNMQYQTLAASRKKDLTERTAAACLRARTMLANR